jgi:hypothetical protein
MLPGYNLTVSLQEIRTQPKEPILLIHGEADNNTGARPA